MVWETEWNHTVTCDHSYDKRCHKSFVTTYQAQQVTQKCVRLILQKKKTRQLKQQFFVLVLSIHNLFFDHELLCFYAIYCNCNQNKFSDSFPAEMVKVKKCLNKVLKLNLRVSI